MPVEIIHIPLLEEGTNVWRPVSAERLSGDTFRILGPIPEGELWAFGPGEEVVVEDQVFSDGTSGLVADRPAEDKTALQDWESAERAVNQTIEFSPEPFASATIANVQDFVAACRIQCPTPDGISKGYWSTVQFCWKNLEVEIFDDRYELYLFAQGRIDIEYFNHTPGTEISPDLMVKLPKCEPLES